MLRFLLAPFLLGTTLLGSTWIDDYSRAWLLFERPDPDSAIEAAKQLVDRYPNSYRAHSLLHRAFAYSARAILNCFVIDVCCQATSRSPSPTRRERLL